MPSATKSIAHQLFRIQALNLILYTSRSIPPHIRTSGNIFKHHQKGANIPATKRRKKKIKILIKTSNLSRHLGYWDDIASGLNSYDAIANMITDHGGVARKQPIPEINGIYNEKIEEMLSYIQQSLENEG